MVRTPDAFSILDTRIALAAAKSAKTTIAAPLRENQLPKPIPSGRKGINNAASGEDIDRKKNNQNHLDSLEK